MEQTPQTLANELKQLIIDELNLEDYSVDDISNTDPIFADEGLGLDSIDALELGIAIKNKYKINVEAQEEIKKHFYSIETLTNYLNDQKSGEISDE